MLGGEIEKNCLYRNSIVDLEISLRDLIWMSIRESLVYLSPSLAIEACMCTGSACWIQRVG